MAAQIPAMAPLGLGKLALTGIPTAIAGLYNIGANINDYIDDHIRQMKASDNCTIAQTGHVMESAKFGFGLGYLSSVAIMATGQLILGNTLSAAGTVASAAALSNPIAMTCAAFGAIYYGWNALKPQEKQDILEKLAHGLEIGIELIKSIIQFLIAKTKEVFSAENIAQFKGFIKEYAAKFGKSLYDITGKVTDLVKGAAEKAGEMTIKAGELTSHAVGYTATTAKEALVKTADVAAGAVDASSEALKVAYQKSAEVAAKAADTTSSAVKAAYEKTEGTTSHAAEMTSNLFKSALGKAPSAVNKPGDATQQALEQENSQPKAGKKD